MASLTGRDGGPASRVKGFMKQLHLYRVEQAKKTGWAAEAKKLQTDRWDTHHGKGEGLRTQSLITEAA